MNYLINNTQFTVNPDGSQGRITFVFWTVVETFESVQVYLFNRGTPIPADYAPADKPYAETTEQDVIDWIIDLEDQESIAAQLAIQVDKVTHPTTGSGKPWQESFPLWAVDVAVAVDDVRIYENVGYQCVQAHTTQAQWAPPATPALWRLYVPPSEGPQPWVQPTGAQDAYQIGAQVTHVGNIWTSLVDANVWEPGTNATLWQDGGPYP